MPATKRQYGHIIDTIRPRRPPSSSLSCSSLQLSPIYIRWFVVGPGFLFPLWLGASVSANKANREHDGLLHILTQSTVEWVGYIGRILSSRESPNWSMGPYIQQTLLLLLAPALFAASVYMMLGRIVTLVDAEHLCIVRRKWLTKFFVCGDVLSFTVQAAGEQNSPSGLKMRGT